MLAAGTALLARPIPFAPHGPVARVTRYRGEVAGTAIWPRQMPPVHRGTDVPSFLAELIDGRVDLRDRQPGGLPPRVGLPPAEPTACLGAPGIPGRPWLAARFAGPNCPLCGSSAEAPLHSGFTWRAPSAQSHTPPDRTTGGISPLSVFPPCGGKEMQKPSPDPGCAWVPNGDVDRQTTNKNPNQRKWSGMVVDVCEDRLERVSGWSKGRKRCSGGGCENGRPRRVEIKDTRYQIPY